jgi:hypothetical protein|tara:strand:- start:10615 stop:12474 length:1860 start_codon:yes stop_codon:yes gene_type:complete
MATNLNVTELDFDQIKQNLKNFLKQQEEYTDYDFEGSGLSTLLDVLAYNTHYNAMNAHYSLNEAFLDSAQIRGNVVTRAKLLGYTPRSVLSARARVQITVDISGEDQATKDNTTSLTLPRGTKLKAEVGNDKFEFVVLDNHSVDVIANTHTFVFNNIEIAEGTYKTLLYRVDNDIENQKFQLGDKDADTSTLRVRVQQNEQAVAYDIYTKFESLLNVDSTSQIYYLQENPSELFEVYFGDGIVGRKPINNNIVTLDYVYTKGEEANGASTFSMVDTVGGFVGAAVKVTDAAGGTERETLESIRFNAPLTFTAQNRAVTSDDYRGILLKNFANISSISTWGGEDNDPPDFGTVYVSIKPLTANTLTDAEKANIKSTVLKGKNVVSVTPEIVDPAFTNLELDVFFKYNPNLTDRSSVDLQTVVKDVIADYNFNNLNKFDGVFRHSQLLKAIDSADPSILNSTVRPYMYQDITPSVVSGQNNHSLTFAAPFYQAGNSTDFILTSSSFNIGSVPHFFGDKPISGSTNRTVIVYKIIENENITVIKDAGTIDVSKGTVTLHSFTPDTVASIRITLTPNSLDIAPKRNQLLNIDNSKVIVTAQVDTITTAGSAGSIDYAVNSRLR